MNNKVVLQYCYYLEKKGHAFRTYYQFGTNNQIIIKRNNKEFKYWIFIGSTLDKRNFFKFAELLTEKGISVKEYSNGEKTFSGRKLNYKEIQMLKN